MHVLNSHENFQVFAWFGYFSSHKIPEIGCRETDIWNIVACGWVTLKGRQTDGQTILTIPPSRKQVWVTDSLTVKMHHDSKTSLINWFIYLSYHQASDISHTLVGNQLVDHWDVVGASAMLQLHLHSRLNAWLQRIGQRQLQNEMRTFKFFELVRLILEFWWQC